MFTIHTVRTGSHLLLSEKEFSHLLQKARQIEPIEVVETQAGVIETEEDRQAYLEGMKDLEQDKIIDFNELKSSWLLGKSADV